MPLCRISVSYDIPWNKPTKLSSEVAIRRRSIATAQQMMSILTQLGYTQLSELFWLSPIDYEPNLVSTLSYKILAQPGLRESLGSLFSTKVYDSPLNLIETMENMSSTPAERPGSAKPLTATLKDFVH